MADEWTSVERTATGPDGAKMAYTGGGWVPAERTATGPNGAKMAILRQGGGAPASKGQTAPKEPELPSESPRTGADKLTHRLGLGARYALELGVSPVTGLADTPSLINPLMGAASMPGATGGMTIPKSMMPSPQVDKTFRKGLDELGFAKDETKGEKTAHNVSDAIPLVLGAAALTKMGVSAIANTEKVKKLTELFTSAGVKNAAAKAEAAVAKEVEKASGSLKTAAQREQAGLVEEKFKGLEAAKERERLQALLDKPRAPTQSYGETGKNLEGSLKSVIDVNKKARTAAGNEAFKQVGVDAAAKEAAGDFVKLEPTLDKLRDFHKNVEHVPEISSKVKEMISTLTPTGGKKLTFAELEPTRRYFNDLANRLKTEGFQSQTQKVARDAANSLDDAMAAHTPSFKDYKEIWKEKSEPLDILQTKIGRILFDTEGSGSGRQFSKTPDAKIPEKVFSSTENLKLYTEALAGGPKATPQAQAEASAAVQKMALKYFEEMISTKGAAEFSKVAANPATKDVVKALPDVEKVLGGRAKSAENIAERIKSLDAAGDAAASKLSTSKTGFQYREDARKLLETKNKLNETLFRADTMAKQNSMASQKEAVTMYKNVLTQAKDAKKISNETYEAMVTVMDSIPSTLQRARFAQGLAKTAALGLIGYTGYRTVDMVTKTGH